MSDKPAWVLRASPGIDGQAKLSFAGTCNSALARELIDAARNTNPVDVHFTSSGCIACLRGRLSANHPPE